MGKIVYCVFIWLWQLAPAWGQDSLQVYFVDYGDDAAGFATVTFAGELQRVANERGVVAIPGGLLPEDSIRVEYIGCETARSTLREVAIKDFAIPIDCGKSVMGLVFEVIGRRDERREQLLARVEVIGAGDIARAQSLTTVDALAKLSGVYVQKSQFGGGSPVLRGFEANRVLLVVDGVRMNNAIYRSGHLQNAISVDPLALDRIEVIYGAGSLAYGSDALGGVVHFRTRVPEFRALTQDAGLRTEIAVQGATAARALTLGTILEYGHGNCVGMTVLSTTRTSNLRAGAQTLKIYPDFGLRPTYVERYDGQDVVVANPNPHRQIGTAYSQYNFLQKFRFRLRPRLVLNTNLQFSTTGNIPRYDALTERRNEQLRWARWDYGPQTRTLAATTLTDHRPTKAYDLATYALSHQFVRESRIRRRFGDPLEESNVESVHSLNVQADFAKAIGRFTLRYGLDARYDRVLSQAKLRNVDSDSAIPDLLATRYPSDGSYLVGSGMYVDADQALNTRWHLRGGLRLAWQYLQASFSENDPVNWPASYTKGISNQTLPLTGSLGLRRNTTRTSFRLVATQGYRAPNVDDFAKFREKNGFLQIPNPNLKSELATTLESGYSIQLADRRVRLATTIYHTWLRNAIIRGPGTLPNGQSYLVNRSDTLQTQTNLNADQASIYGFNLDVGLTPCPNLTFAFRLSALRGRRQQVAPDGQTLILPQDHIPPPYGSAAFTYHKPTWSTGLRIRFQSAKPVDQYAVAAISVRNDDTYTLDRTGTSDNLEFTPYNEQTGNYTGSPAWWTLNLFATYNPGERWTLHLKADNLLDRHYRTFSSGVSSPGLDVGLTINYHFQSR